MTFDDTLLIELIEDGLVDVYMGQDGSVRIAPTTKGQRALEGDDEEEEVDDDEFGDDEDDDVADDEDEDLE